MSRAADGMRSKHRKLPHTASRGVSNPEGTSFYPFPRLLDVTSSIDLKTDFMSEPDRQKRQLQPAQRLLQHLRRNVVACCLAANDSRVLTEEAWQCLFDFPNGSCKPAYFSPQPLPSKRSVRGCHVVNSTPACEWNITSGELTRNKCTVQSGNAFSFGAFLSYQQ